MLVAVGVDANNQLFSLAFAIVEGENNNSWGLFMAYLRARVTQRPDLCVISDRHKGIITAMNDEYLGWALGRAHHRFCVRHLASNFNSRFHDKSLKMVLVRAAYERQPRKFNCRMERIGRVSADMQAWLTLYLWRSGPYRMTTGKDSA